jgi:flagellar basal-body rod modification protein FlgD
MTNRVDLNALDPSLRQGSGNPIGANKALDQDAFLKLFLAQLENQDPLDPADSAEFSSQMAQFSTVEQGVKTNELLEQLVAQSNDVSSLSSYLGNTVRMDASSIAIENGNAGKISFDIADAASVLKVEFLDDEGNVKGEKVFNNLEAGANTVELNNLSIFSGQYSIKATATNANGISTEPKVYKSGLVGGYIPGPSPTLLVDGKEVSPSEILQVTIA